MYPLQSPPLRGAERVTVRLLIVDDHASWRRQVVETLAVDPRFRVVGEALDGAEAVHAAERLQPDVVVLDVGLPSLTGIEVARRVRVSCPDSKILFLSAHGRDVARAALSTGAHGYVIKSDMARELVPALQAVLAGVRYVSARLSLPRDAAPTTPPEIRPEQVK